jgi:hypothetical protein
MKQCALLAMIAASCWIGMRQTARASTKNIAPAATPIMGVAIDAIGSDDVIVANAGPIAQINDGVFNGNLSTGAYVINGDGSTGAQGNGADTYDGGRPNYQFDFVGALFATPQFGVTSVRVQNYLANDGGWWGPTNVANGGAPLSIADLVAPQVQVTSDLGATWTAVAGVSVDYLQKYIGVPRGTGFPNATSTPFSTFTFAPQNGINGIRLIGEGAGPADGSGFIGVNEFEVLGAAQELSLEVNVATGRVRLVNNVQVPISLDLYRIDSPSGALDLSAVGWNRLESPSLNPAGFPAGSGSGDGWETLGTPHANSVAEAFLLGNSTLAASEFVSLGELYAGGAQDLTLRYRDSSGAFVNVSATYVAKPALAADFNDDDRVDAVDLALWRAGMGVSAEADADGDGDGDGADFLVWQQQFGAVALTDAAVQSVPEPSATVMAACTLGLLPALGQAGAVHSATGRRNG